MNQTSGFNKAQRLLGPRDFSYLRENSRSVSSRYLRSYFKDSRLSYGHCRIGLSVSKKTGNAVKRNKIKRVLREEFRSSSLSKLPIDLLLIASPRLSAINDRKELSEIIRLNFQELSARLEKKINGKHS